MSDLSTHVKYYPEASDGLPVDTTGAIRPGRMKTEVKWIVIHEAGNSSVNAGCDNHLSYLKNLTISNLSTYNSNIAKGVSGYTGLTYISFNWFVQGRNLTTGELAKCYNLVPDEEIAWCNADGSTPEGGNMKGISIEIADSVSYDYEDGLDQAIKLVAFLMNKHGLGRENILTHQDCYSAKTCPYQLITNGRVDWFKDQCVAELEETYGVKAGTTSSGTTSTTTSTSTSTTTTTTTTTTASTANRYKVGDVVTVNGTIYGSAWKQAGSISVSNKEYTITSVCNLSGVTAPYQLGVIGFTDESNIVSNTTTSDVYEPAVGDSVYVTGTVYGSAWKNAGSIVLNNQKTTITQIYTDKGASANYKVGTMGFTTLDCITKA